MTIFELGFYNHAKEIQEKYLSTIEIYLFDIESIPELWDLFHTTEISRALGLKLAHQKQLAYFGCINLAEGYKNELGKSIVFYLSTEE